jgi:RNA polymerase sigma-70 factor, ECF subfamily
VTLTSHLERMQRAASALCASPHDAEDLVQETCVRVLSRPRELDLRDEVPYLMRALRNTYLTSLRTASRRPRTVALPPGDSAVLASSNTAPHVVVERNQVLDAVATLPDHFRRALVAVEIVGLSHRDAARALGAPEHTITTRVFRARRRVAHALEPGRSRSMIERAGPDSSAG